MSQKEKEQELDQSLPAIPEDFRAVIMYGMTKEEALAIMRAVKSVGPSMHEVAFAMSTETNIQWPLGQLVAELSEEHRMMKEYRAAHGKESIVS